MSLHLLIESGTRLWLEGVEPSMVVRHRGLGATGAVSDLTGGPVPSVDAPERPDGSGRVTWAVADFLATEAERTFLPVWNRTDGDDGYVSVSPVSAAEAAAVPSGRATRLYVELGGLWAAGHPNRLIAVPATPAGLAALEDLAARGVNLNVTWVVTPRQYELARDAVWRGAQRRPDRGRALKCVFSVPVAPVDAYVDRHVPGLSAEARGQVGLVNAKRLHRLNADAWADLGRRLRHRQEIVFTHTAATRPGDAADRYVAALAGSGIQANPAAMIEAVNQLPHDYLRQVDQLPAPAVLAEIDVKVNADAMGCALMQRVA